MSAVVVGDVPIRDPDRYRVLTPGQKSDIFYGNAMTFFRQSHVALAKSR
jgi:hypothetical protein